MQAFTFSFLDITQHAFATVFMSGSSRRYRVSVDRTYCILAQDKGRTVWIQLKTNHSTVQANDRLQAIGKGMVDAGMVVA